MPKKIFIKSFTKHEIDLNWLENILKELRAQQEEGGDGDEMAAEAAQSPEASTPDEPASDEPAPPEPNDS